MIGERGAEYWLGRVSKVKNGDDPWENTQVVFDSDPHGEEPMWVCPWEIDLAPVRYRDEPSTAVDGTADAANDDDETETRRNAEHLEKCEHGTNIAVRLGWPQATKAARDEFVTWREACSPHTRYVLGLSQIPPTVSSPSVTTLVIKRKYTTYITSGLFAYTVRLETDIFLLHAGPCARPRFAARSLIFTKS